MMLYDDCPNCQAGYHDKCLSSPDSHKFICICPICNALDYANTEFNDYNLSILAHHIEQMNPNQIETFKKMLKLTS